MSGPSVRSAVCLLRALPLEAVETSSVTERCLEAIFGRPAPDVLTRFAGFWLSKRKGRGMPSIGDMDPLEMPWALPHIFVMARNGEGRFAFQLVGDLTATRLGGLVKGKTADLVLEPAYAQTTEERWNTAAASHMIYFNNSYHHTANMWPVASVRITMPLSSDGLSVDRLIGVAHFTELTQVVDRNAFSSFIRWTPVSDLPQESDGEERSDPR